MTNHLTPAEQFDIARQAMASLELFQRQYASSAPYVEHRQKVVEMVSAAAARARPTGDNFLTAFAAALQKI